MICPIFFSIALNLSLNNFLRSFTSIMCTHGPARAILYINTAKRRLCTWQLKGSNILLSTPVQYCVAYYVLHIYNAVLTGIPSFSAPCSQRSNAKSQSDAIQSLSHYNCSNGWTETSPELQQYHIIPLGSR